MSDLYKLDGVDSDGMHCEAIGTASEVISVMIMWFERDTILLGADYYHSEKLSQGDTLFS